MELFKKELKELLKKHKASIGFDCGENSDLMGPYDEHMYIKKNNVCFKFPYLWHVNETEL